jgi:uncharacterized protein (TIGR03032 family)
MSAGGVTPREQPGLVAPPTAVECRYTQTATFAALLHQLRASLLASTYQANKLLVVRATGGGLSALVRIFERPMALAVDAHRIALGTRNPVWLVRNAPDIAPRVDPAGQHEACYLPRSCHVTGDIGVHELGSARKSVLRLRRTALQSRPLKRRRLARLRGLTRAAA